MDLEGIILSEISQTEKDKYHMISSVCKVYVETKKQNRKTTEKQTHRYREQSEGGNGAWGLGEKDQGIKKYRLSLASVAQLVGALSYI